MAKVSACFHLLKLLFHTDVYQVIRNVPADLRGDLGESYMVTLVVYNSRAPKGVAALYVQSGCLAQMGQRGPGMCWSSGGLILGRLQEGG